MIRLMLAFTALLALVEAAAQELDYVELNRCMNEATGYVCPDNTTLYPRGSKLQEMRRVMTRDQARTYCTCAVTNNWEPVQVELCLGLARTCEYGDL